MYIDVHGWAPYSEGYRCGIYHINTKDNSMSFLTEAEVVSITEDMLYVCGDVDGKYQVKEINMASKEERFLCEFKWDGYIYTFNNINGKLKLRLNDFGINEELKIMIIDVKSGEYQLFDVD